MAKLDGQLAGRDLRYLFCRVLRSIHCYRTVQYGIRLTKKDKERYFMQFQTRRHNTRYKKHTKCFLSDESVVSLWFVRLRGF